VDDKVKKLQQKKLSSFLIVFLNKTISSLSFR